MNIQDWFPLGWLCGSPCSPRDSQESWTPQFKTIISSSLTVLYGATITSIHDYWKNHSFDYIELFQPSNISILLKNLYSFVVDFFFQTSKHLLISWLQSSSIVILEPLKITSLIASIVSPSICHEVMGPNAMIFIFWMWGLDQMFHSPISIWSRGSLVLQFSPWEWCLLHIWSSWYFSQQSWFQLVLHPVGHFTWCTLQIQDI